MGVLVENGDLLVAPITLQDPNFAHSVVLICEHVPGKGSYGLVLNQPVRPMPELLKEFPYARENLFKGGPVRTEVLQVLHPYGELLPESLPILPEVWLGGNVETLQAGFDNGAFRPADCRFFLGYSGWGGDQLATEFDMNSWLRVRGDAELIFQVPSSVMWNRAIRRLGAENPMYANFPDFPGGN